MKTRSFLGTSLALVAFASASLLPTPAFARAPQVALPATAPVTKAQESYIKESHGADGNEDEAQTAIRRFKPVHGNGPSIYLVAAIHIGEKSYYKQIQQFLDKQDVVLYEGVRPSRTAAKIKLAPATEPHASRAANAPVGIQKKLSDALNLQFQLEGIHYNRPQFYNSDLDWDAMTALATKAGPDTRKSLDRLANSVSGGPSVSLSAQILDKLLTVASFTPILAKTLRHLFVTILCDPDAVAKLAKQTQGGVPISEKSLDSIVIGERNKVVLADIKSLLKTAKRKSPTPIHSIAVFYGAEHMKDMERHIVSDFGYRSAETQWITAIRVVD